jgi:hypothetical protein
LKAKEIDWPIEIDKIIRDLDEVLFVKIEYFEDDHLAMANNVIRQMKYKIKQSIERLEALVD